MAYARLKILLLYYSCYIVRNWGTQIYWLTVPINSSKNYSILSPCFGIKIPSSVGIDTYSVKLMIIKGASMRLVNKKNNLGQNTHNTNEHNLQIELNKQSGNRLTEEVSLIVCTVVRSWNVSSLVQLTTFQL